MQSPKKTSIHDPLMQRIAGHAMLAMCGILAVGIAIAAVTSGRADASPTAVVRFVPDPAPVQQQQQQQQQAPALENLSAKDADDLTSMAPSVDPAPALAPAFVPALSDSASKIQIIPRKSTKVASSRTRVIHMEVTAYCPCKQCCGKQARGITASGKHVSHRGGKFVAADTKLLPFWTKLSIPGYHGGRPVEVLDRGGDIKGNRLDVFFKSHREAQQWGRRIVPVTVYQ